MADDIVYRSTAAFIESLHIKSRRIATVIAGVFVDPSINIVGCDTRFNARFQHIQSFPRQPTASANTFDLFVGLNNNA